MVNRSDQFGNKQNVFDIWHIIGKDYYYCGYMFESNDLFQDDNRKALYQSPSQLTLILVHHTILM